MKTILIIVAAFELAFTAQAQTTPPTGTVNLTEKVTLPKPSTTPYFAINVPASDLAAKIADAQAQCPSGKTVYGLNVSLNSVTHLYTVSANYR